MAEPEIGNGSVDVSRARVVRMVKAWIRQRRPAAVVRFLEGEGRLLAADPSDPESMRVAANKVRRQAGLSLSDEDLLKVRALVMHAFDEADVVGIRGGASYSDEHKMWVRRIEQIFEDRVAGGRKPAYVSRGQISHSLRDRLPELLADEQRISVISCRDVQETLRATCDVEDVRVFQVPSQYVMRAVDDEYEARLHDVPIWPEFHRQLHDDLTVRHPGEVFLVGAGLFGKDLCIRIRDLGGIALDLGSCLDTMANKVTRGPGKPKPRLLPPPR